MHGFKSAILAIFHFFQNGTFEPMHEIWHFFWPRACLKVRQIQDLGRKKYKKGIFIKSPRGNWNFIFVLGSYDSLERMEG